MTGPLAVVLDAPDVLWAGRTATNPVHRIADSADWLVHDGPEGQRATHSSTGARLQVNGDGPGGSQRAGVRHLGRHPVHVARQHH